ncbi:Rossmann-like domain-containing protein [Methanobacterium ferruginis]|jgi:uncharacterized protein (DUF4213/DUF364 family)|uniref:Rossmann-like domain-containing protein n=1 Tax=Methanobacterium ferruginis TaxID=710191 RepID=UPI00257400CF|nr:DUF364 domain-containing protein [Methanobacterium ferruginis]MCC7550743.1 hypothetical protein [Methanobacterium sp.]BDZ67503.1 hypothetical protein GCM10025860_09510 [Methanobacterium ferruginis]
MKLVNDLMEAASENNSPVNDVRVGVSWTGVHGKYGGVSKTYGIPVVHGNYTRDLGNLTNKTTMELAEYVKSWNLVEASVGVAALNSMMKPRGKKDVNAQDLIIEESQNKKVIMVGKFPKIDEIRSVAKEFWVLEADPTLTNPKEGIITEAAAEYVFPGSDIIIITGSTLINKGLERYLNLAKQEDAYTIVMGPSTTMCDVLFDYGADMLAGVELLDPEAILRKISQSGGMINTRVCKGEIGFRVLEG